jgi:hypothetical protein
MTMMQERDQPPVPGGVPKVALVVAAVSLVGIMALVVVALAIAGKLDARSTPLVVSMLSAVLGMVPALFAAVYSERAVRDIRNGVLEDKARAGAARAIQDENASGEDSARAVLELLRGTGYVRGGVPPLPPRRHAADGGNGDSEAPPG